MFGSNVKISSRKLNLGLDMKDLDTPGYKYGHDLGDATAIKIQKNTQNVEQSQDREDRPFGPTLAAVKFVRVTIKFTGSCKNFGCVLVLKLYKNNHTIIELIYFHLE
jgi:hypothetical protein